MSNKKVARRYTQALFELAEELKLTDKVIKDFSDLLKSIEGSKELKAFLKSPMIKSPKKGKALGEMFKGKLSDLTLKFIDLLVKKERENYLYDICKDFLDLVNQRRGIIKANIKTAITLADKDKKILTEKLAQYTGKSIEPNFTVDNSIKGGFIAQIDDKIIDASILRQLEILKAQFVKGSFTVN